MITKEWRCPVWYMMRRGNSEAFVVKTKEGYIKTYKGYLILACDGSDLNILSTPENREKFHQSSKNGNYPRPQAGISCLFDVLNRQVCDCAVSYNKTSERYEALSHIKKRRNYRQEESCLCF